MCLAFCPECGDCFGPLHFDRTGHAPLDVVRYAEGCSHGECF